MGKQARIRRERRRTPEENAFEKAMRRIGRRKDLVDVELRKADFAQSLDAQAELLEGTPGQIRSDAAVVQLARQILESRGLNCDGVMITAALRMGRLQIWTRIDPDARQVAAREARADMQARLEAAAAGQAMATL